jgi:hypothetical protein
MEMSGQLHVPAALPAWKEPPVPKRLGGPQSQFERGVEEKNSLHCPCRESNPGRPARSLVITLTELSQLPMLKVITIYFLIYISHKVLQKHMTRI